jgi:hypothetical protein
MFEEYTTVRELPQEGAILIGEEHGNSRCAELARKVLDYYEPPTVAVENHTPYRGRRNYSAMREVAAYASRENAPQVGIDEYTRRLWGSAPNRIELLEDANRFSYPILEDGDLTEQAITDARERIADKYSERIWKEMYEYRERLMAARLRSIVAEYEAPVVAAVGTFHINRLAEYLSQRDWTLSVGDSRVSQPSPRATSEI